MTEKPTSETRKKRTATRKRATTSGPPPKKKAGAAKSRAKKRAPARPAGASATDVVEAEAESSGPRRGLVRVLAADDQQEVLDLVTELCHSRGTDVTCHRDPEEALAEFKRSPKSFSMAIIDFDFGRGKMNGIELLKELKKISTDLPVVILSGQGTTDLAVKAGQAEVTDWIPKDFDLEDQLQKQLLKLDRLVSWLDELREVKESNKELTARVDFYQEEFYRKYRMVGQDESVREVMEQVERLAPIPRPVLIRGERGTGKELVAAAIHQASPRNNGPFVTLNCAALSEGLLECEVFGQEENAFNNAPFRRGRFELAHKGTLFLDEIGNMPHDFQQKILRVLEYQTFERVGGGQTIRVDVRVVAATNADLEKYMRRGRFREDLYDRLAFESIRLPPLRERRGDIPLLAAHFLRVISSEVPGIEPQGFTREAEEAMREFSWPGNVRELKFFVERVAYRTKGEVIGRKDLPALEARTEPADDTDRGTFRQRVAKYKHRVIEDTLARCQGDRNKAAKMLSLSMEELADLADGLEAQV